MENMRPFLYLVTGIFIGFWTSWPGIISPRNWKCFKAIVTKSSKEKILLKAKLAISPNYLIKGKKNKLLSNLRIVSDACFR